MGRRLISLETERKIKQRVALQLLDCRTMLDHNIHEVYLASDELTRSGHPVKNILLLLSAAPEVIVRDKISALHIAIVRTIK